MNRKNSCFFPTNRKVACPGGNLHMSGYGDVPLFLVLFVGTPGFLGTFLVPFLGYSRIFGYHFFGKI